MNKSFLNRTWIDIDLDRLIANYHTAKSLTDATVTCVVKSNAYGHGAVRVSQALQEAGCESFAVSCAREALELRRAGIHGEILVMGLTEPAILAKVIHEGITLTVGDMEDIDTAEDAARELGMPAHLQVKLDTGFHRLGFDCTEETVNAIAGRAPQLQFARLDGLYSHLGLNSKELDAAQHERLMWMQEQLASRGVVINDVHLCDSIGLVRYPQWHHSRVRVGALLFGVRPYHSEDMPFACHETLAFRTTVAQVRLVKAGEVVGYSGKHPLDHDAQIATLCAGYGDGYPRCLSNGNGQVMIRGKLAPVVGLICMDQMMVDVSDIPDVSKGDTVDLLGGGIPYQQVADGAHTNRNECITILSRRPLRVYHQGGSIVTVEDSMLDEGGNE